MLLTLRPPPRRALRRLGFAAACAAVVTMTGAAAAQELRGVRMTLGLQQGVEAGRNLALATPAEGTTLRSLTDLNLRFLSETRTQQLSFDTGTRLTLGDVRNGNDRIFTDPQFRLSYRREGVDSLLTVGARFRTSRVRFLRTLDEFIDEDGVLVLPEDFTDLTGAGTRTDFGLNAGLEIGREAAPIGLTLRAALDGRSYANVTNPSLFDARTVNLGATMRLRLSPVASAFLTVDRGRTRNEDAVSTRRSSDRVSVGLTYDIDPATRMTGSLGLSRRDTTELGVRVNRSEGAVGQFALTREMPGGVVSGRFGVERVDAGQRMNLSASRSWERPLGAVAGELGLTRGPGGEVNAIGSLDWRRETPDGDVTVALRRSVGTTAANEERINTTLSLRYGHRFTEVSSVSLRLDHAIADATPSASGVQRTDVGISYAHQLTPDWALNTGVNYRTRRSDGRRATSPSVRISLGRSFDFRL